MKREKFSQEQLIQAIKFLGSSYSSADTIHTYKKSPIHILVYEEILRFTKEEIDTNPMKSPDGFSLWGICFSIRNPYIFSAFLKIGAFRNKLHPDAKWILDQNPNPSDDLYSLVYDVQSSYNSINSHIDKDEPYARDFLFKCLFDSYYNNFHNLDTPEKINTIDNYLRDFGKKKENELLYFLYKNYDEKEKKLKICDYLVPKMKEIGIDFGQNDLLNNFLPKESYLNRDSKNFFISSSDIPRMNNLIKCGFKFNEKDYSFYGDNLFIGVLKSNRRDILETILPELTSIKPKFGTIEEQNQFVKNYLKTIHLPDLFQLIQTKYDYLILKDELSNESDNKLEKKKIKI
jgi:hypothetical protein